MSGIELVEQIVHQHRLAALERRDQALSHISEKQAKLDDLEENNASKSIDYRGAAYQTRRLVSAGTFLDGGGLSGGSEALTRRKVTSIQPARCDLP
jgi:hypothetical protein